MQIGGFPSSEFPVEYWSLIQFDLEEIPADALIKSASLVMRLSKAGGADFLEIGVTYITESWNEFKVTREDKPRAFSGVGEAIIKSNVEFTEWDVTELVQEWVNGEKDNQACCYSDL